MNKELLISLSNADAIASQENEVRSILRTELKEFCDDIQYDGLGSVIFHKKSHGNHPIRILFCAHMDEVGFAVRWISDIGMLYLMPVGNVLAKSKYMQNVRITAEDGQKYYGIMNSTRNDDGSIADSYVDIGCETREEVLSHGIDVGAMVCFAQDARMFQKNVCAGKAMDDRSGCAVLAEILKAMPTETENDLYFAATSSEEVGTRGGRTVTSIIKPDIVYVIDTANHPELDRGFTDTRKIGHGPMVEFYDKTMAPNRKLLKYITNTFEANHIPYQKDMMKGGGTDAATAHLENGGTPCAVLGIPLRYCHGSCSLIDCRDIDSLTDACIKMIAGMNGSLNQNIRTYEGEI